MERKVENLVLTGLELLGECEKPFIKDWETIYSTLKRRHYPFIEEMNYMLRFSFQLLSKKRLENADSFILSLMAEWRKHFSEDYDDFNAVFLVTLIENLFHKCLSDKSNSDFLQHQAIQSFFSKILDHSLLEQETEDRTEKWARMIIASNIFPMKWLAVVKKENRDVKIEKVVCSGEHQASQQLVDMCSSLKADEINVLSLAVSRLLSRSEENHQEVIHIPCLTDSLLICTDELREDISEQQIEFVRKMYLRQQKLHHLESKIEWKDAALLFLQRLMGANTAETAIQAISDGLVDYMPFKRCSLYLYAPDDTKRKGCYVNEDGMHLPILKNHLETLTHAQPLYVSNAAEILPEKYIHEHRLKSLVIVPLFVPAKNQLIGLALLDKGEASEFGVSHQTLTALIKLGHYAGELLYPFWNEALQQFRKQKSILSEREKEVLKLIAEGASINDAADRLHLSSYTVRDYVSAIIQKLDAKNRTDAAVKALKMKLIS